MADIPILNRQHARLIYYASSHRTRLLISALGTHGGTKQVTDGVEKIYAEGLLDRLRPLATRADDGVTYSLTSTGWDVFYAGTEWRRDYYGPGVVQGKPVTL